MEEDEVGVGGLEEFSIWWPWALKKEDADWLLESCDLSS